MCPEIRPFSWNWHTPYCGNEAPDSSPCKSPLNLWVPLLSCIPYQCWLSEGTNEADFPEWLRRQWFWLILHLSAHPPSHSLTYYVLIHPSTHMSIHLPIVHPHVHPPTYLSTYLSTIHLPNPTVYPPTRSFTFTNRPIHLSIHSSSNNSPCPVLYPINRVYSRKLMEKYLLLWSGHQSTQQKASL